MGRLYDAIQEIDRLAEARGLDGFRVKGQLNLATGFFVGLIMPDTPDDLEKLVALKDAAKSVLGVDLQA